MNKQLIIRQLGLMDYQITWKQMQAFTASRTDLTADEIWILQHYPVFTQGQAGKPEHILNAANIPIIQTDRGGQVTYHGPGQLICYVLLNLHRLNLGIRQLVNRLENSVIQLLADYNINAKNRCDAPGVYVDEAKICSVGLRIKRGYSYHGLALNVNMDLSPFSQINPCGYQGLQMTQLCHYENKINIQTVAEKIIQYLCQNFGYNADQIRFEENLTQY